MHDNPLHHQDCVVWFDQIWLTVDWWHTVNRPCSCHHILGHILINADWCTDIGDVTFFQIGPCPLHTSSKSTDKTKNRKTFSGESAETRGSGPPSHRAYSPSRSACLKRMSAVLNGAPISLWCLVLKNKPSERVQSGAVEINVKSWHKKSLESYFLRCVCWLISMAAVKWQIMERALTVLWCAVQCRHPHTARMHTHTRTNCSK